MGDRGLVWVTALMNESWRRIADRKMGVQHHPAMMSRKKIAPSTAARRGAS
jgi:hypothetical protein